MRPLELQLGRMMKWQALAFYAIGALFALGAVQIVLDALELSAMSFSLALSVIHGLAVLGATVCWLIALWQIFWAGRLAFGVWSGLVYTWLAFVLFIWPGLYVIPHMVRLDVKRLLGAVPDPPWDPVG